MDSSLFLLILIIIAALGFGFSNGMNDAANAIATSIGSRVISPRNGIIIGGVCNLAGSLTGALWGAHVARTIGKGIVDPDHLTLATIVGGVTAAVIWVVLTTRYGMPISVTHSLVAGLLGAGLAAGGPDIIVWSKLTPVLSAVVLAPLLGFVGGFILMVAVLWTVRRKAPDRVNGTFAKMQIIAAAFMAYSHGKNDGQMPIAVIALGLMIYAGNSDLTFPLWVILVSSLSISVGTAAGGWRVIKTVGSRITTLRPAHGFAAQASAAVVIEVASDLGLPISTTHASSASVMGVGATKRLSAVRWGIAGNIVAAWVLTFPLCAAMGWGLGKLLALIF